MKQIRENVYEITHADLGRPSERGWMTIPASTDGLSGKLLLDDADIRFVKEMSAQGYEPTFFVSRSPVMGGEFVVVARQWNNRI